MENKLERKHGKLQPPVAEQDLQRLAGRIKVWGRELGFAQVAIADVDPADLDLARAEQGLLDWLAQGYHGEMDYMARHGSLRARPAELVPGTLRVIAARMDYLPHPETFVEQGWQTLADARRATVARYALGRDYHKVVRGRLQRLADRIADELGPFGHRVFSDSAPVMEVELARKAGLGWRGKHTLLLSRDAGSMFFLGELFVDLALPVDQAQTDHCGSCQACIDVCPTGAIVGPYRLDARRCISYLTIELKGSIPEELRPLLGNRVYGCDDCQLACPWNKFAQRAVLADFESRGLDAVSLLEIFGWSEAQFLQRTEGSPIRRIGYQRWLRNIAVCLGNSLSTPLGVDERRAVIEALAARVNDPSSLVREHVAWALGREQDEQDEQARYE